MQIKTTWDTISYWLRKSFPHSSVKEPTCNAGDPGSIPGSGRSAGEGIGYPLQYSWASLVVQLVKNPPAMQPRETWVGKIPWRREKLPFPVFCPAEFHGLNVKSMGSQRAEHDWVTFTFKEKWNILNSDSTRYWWEFEIRELVSFNILLLGE